MRLRGSLSARTLRQLKILWEVGMSKKSKADAPVREIGEIPFALCEIVAALEGAGLKEKAAVAESIIDLLIEQPSLKLLELPQEVKTEIKSVIERNLPRVADFENKRLASA